MHPCNYCTFTKMKHDAKRKGTRLVIRKSSFAPFDVKGIDVFEVPKGMKLPPYKQPSSKLPNGCKVRQKYWRAFFMTLPDHCVC